MNQIEAAKIMMNIGCLNDIAEKTHDAIVKKQLGDVVINLEVLVNEYLLENSA